MSTIDDLRAQVRKRRSAVTGKERRILNNTGIKIADTAEDPRRAPSAIKKYNTTQLNNYLKTLDAFMQRDNGYVPDSSGGFIRKAEWLGYKRSEVKFNKIVKSHFDKIAMIRDPYRNVTIKDAEVLFVPDSARAQGEIRHRPYNEINRNSSNIKSVEALRKLQAQVNGKLSKDYLGNAIQAGRKQAGQMLDNAGISSLKTKLAGLSDMQFDVLWNYWGFAGRLAQIGESGGQRKGIVDRHDPLDAEQKDNIKQDVSDFIDSAEKLKFDKNKNQILDSKKTNKQKNKKIRSAYDKMQIEKNK